MYKKSLGMAAAVAVFAFSAPAFAEGDAEKGEKVFKKCKACHAVGEGAKAKIGPPLNNVVGGAAGMFEGYKYGKSLKAAGEAGLIWTEEELDEYLKSPKKYLRKKLDSKKAKSKMAFKLKKDKDRANIIAYLKTFSKPAE